ncbi:MAG: hypothetical protein ACR2Q4_08620, partial [Geminicoccaceae bacterium]
MTATDAEAGRAGWSVEPGIPIASGRSLCFSSSRQKDSKGAKAMTTTNKLEFGTNKLKSGIGV